MPRRGIHATRKRELGSGCTETLGEITLSWLGNFCLPPFDFDMSGTARLIDDPIRDPSRPTPG